MGALRYQRNGTDCSRHVLIEGNYPHHGAVMFGHYGKQFFEVVKFLGLDVKKIGYNQPAGVRYPTENPWG